MSRLCHISMVNTYGFIPDAHVHWHICVRIISLRAISSPNNNSQSTCWNFGQESHSSCCQKHIFCFCHFCPAAMRGTRPATAKIESIDLTASPQARRAPAPRGARDRNVMSALQANAAPAGYSPPVALRLDAAGKGAGSRPPRGRKGSKSGKGLEDVAVQAIPHRVIEGPPMHVEAARKEVSTRFGSTRVWGGSITLVEAVEFFASRVSRVEGKYQFSTDCYHESELAATCGLELREVPGYKKAPGEGDEDAPESIQREKRNGVPTWLLGFSVGCSCKEVRFLFCLDVEPPVLDVDIVCSHLREMLEIATSHGLKREQLESYAGARLDETSGEVECNAHRTHMLIQIPTNTITDVTAAVATAAATAATTTTATYRTRRRWATDCNSEGRESLVTETDIKQLVNRLGYGNSGQSWVHQQGFERLPRAVAELKPELQGVRDVVNANCSERTKNACENRRHPELTCVSVTLQARERKKMKHIDAAMQSAEASMRSILGDGGFVWSWSPSLLENVRSAIKELAKLNIFTCLKPVPHTSEEYRIFVRTKHPEADFNPLPPRELEARREGLVVTRWLSPGKVTKELNRGGRPIVNAARAVAPWLLYNQNKESKEVEWFDSHRGVWCQRGGEFMLGADQLQRALADQIKTYRLELVVQESGKTKLVPIAEPSALIFNDTAFCGPVRQALQSIHQPLLRLLDSDPANAFRLACANGITLDFSVGYESQVQPSDPKHRNSRFTSWTFEPYEDEDAKGMADLADNLLTYLEDCEKRKRTPDLRSSGLTRKFVEHMQAAPGRANVFRDIYYEPLGGLLQSSDPENVVEEAIYELREDAGMLSGRRKGHETFKVLFGPHGNSGKGTRFKLWREILDVNDRSKNHGYLAVVGPGLVKNAMDVDLCSEDRAALNGSRAAVIDDFGTDTKPICGPTVRNLTGGNDVSAHGKNEKKQTFPPDVHVNLICNTELETHPPLIGPDQRRMSITRYDCTFQGPQGFDAKNVTHRRMNAHVKDNVKQFAPALIEWTRRLAQGSQLGHCKATWPMPLSMRKEVSRWMGKA